MNLNPLLPAVIILAASTVGAKYESPIMESPTSFSVMTDDGLRLELDRSSGNGSALEVGGRSFGLSGPLVRFEEVVEIPGAEDLLQGVSWGMPDESFEEPANGGGTPPPTPSLQGRGDTGATSLPPTDKWLRVSGEDSARPKARVEVNQTEPQPLVLSGWCQAKVEGSAFGWWDRNLALNANVTYSDGTRMPEVSAYFGQYDHGPQFNKRVICPDRPIRSLDIDLSVPGGKCSAWYSDVKLQPAEYLIYSPSAALKRQDYSVQQEFDISWERACPHAPSPDAREDTRAPRLRGLVEYRPKPECIEVRCSFESAQHSDRAVSAYLAIPFDAIGGVWHDDARTSRKIKAGELYRSGSWYGAGRDGYNSRYPFACIETASGHGLAIGTSVGEPRVFQAEYDARKRELRIRFDIGLGAVSPSPDPPRPPPGPTLPRGGQGGVAGPLDDQGIVHGLPLLLHRRLPGRGGEVPSDVRLGLREPRREAGTLAAVHDAARDRRA